MYPVALAPLVQKAKNTAVEIPCADHATPSIHKKLVLTLPTSGGRLVDIVCSYFVFHACLICTQIPANVSFCLTEIYNHTNIDIWACHLILPPFPASRTWARVVIFYIIVAVFRGHMMSFSVISSKQKIGRRNLQSWMAKSKSFDRFSIQEP
jgi:hypothetical protein